MDGGLCRAAFLLPRFLSGFSPDRDYRNLSFTSLTHLVTPLGPTDVTLAYMDHPLRSESFTVRNSWENTKTWFGAIRQALGQKTEISFSFRRHSDLFVLFRDDPAYFTNHHALETYQAAVRRKETLSQNVTLHYGAEGYPTTPSSVIIWAITRADGPPATHRSTFARCTASPSPSARGKRSTAPFPASSVRASPEVSGYRRIFGSEPAPAARFACPATRISIIMTLNLGNPNLLPERAWSYEGGLDWTANSKLRGELVVFQRRESDGIDYVRYSPTDLWRATNIQNLHFIGVEASLVWKVTAAQQIDLRYTGLHGAQDTLTPGVMSQYAFNFPSNEGVAAWRVSLPWGLSARTRVGALQRLRQEPYALWDLYIAESRGRIHPFLQLTNLTSTTYQEIQGVLMPARSIVGGIEIAVFTRK